MNGMWCGSNVGSSIRNSMLMRSPFGNNALAALDDAAGIQQELGGLAQQRAVLAGAIGNRRHNRARQRPHREGGPWNGSSNASSSTLGGPCAIMSEF